MLSITFNFLIPYLVVRYICNNPLRNSYLFNEKIQFIRSSLLTHNIHISLRLGVGCPQLGQVPHLGLYLQTYLS